MDANIEIINERGQTIFVDTLDKEEDISLGRDRCNHVVIPSNQASRQHGLIYFESGKYFFKDTSRNGSGIKDIILRSEARALNHGDVITVGDFKVLFKQGPLAKGVVRLQNTTIAEPILNKSGNQHYGLEHYDKDLSQYKIIPIDGDYFTIGSEEKDNVREESLEAGHVGIIILNDRPYIQCKSEGITLNGIELSSDPEILQDNDLIKAGRKRHKFKIFNSKVSKEYKYKIVTDSPCIQNIIVAIDRCCKFDEPIMIFGETGTGKELVARAIHHASGRSEYPFIAVNCAEIENNLASSILFGHERGSFTGASSSHIGLIEQADHGTLFLDELGELTYDVQSKLLRAIQFGEIRPVGSLKTKKVNIRVVTATHRNLVEPEEREKINFREDLYYRLCIKSIYIPPLRDRREDIPLLMDHFLDLAKVKYPFLGEINFSARAYRLAKDYIWEGNVRELSSLCMNAIIDVEGDIIKSISPPQGRKLSKILKTFLEAYEDNPDEDLMCKKLNIGRSTFYRRKNELVKRGCIAPPSDT
jgi:transcriptional regulator with AAA-type ATPase domain